MIGDHNVIVIFKIKLSQKRFSRLWLFWDTAPPKHTYVKIASFLRISLCGFSSSLEHFRPKSPWANSTVLGKLRAPRGENTIFPSCKGITVIAAIKGHAQSVTRVGIKVRLIPEEARHLSVSHSQDFHWKNLCCVFVIARSMILGAWEMRAFLLT